MSGQLMPGKLTLGKLRLGHLTLGKLTLGKANVTVACIIVHRLLISVHKWQSSGMTDTHEYWSQHDAHLVYLPIFHGLNLIIFSQWKNQN